MNKTLNKKHAYTISYIFSVVCIFFLALAVVKNDPWSENSPFLMAIGALVWQWIFVVWGVWSKE
jgi:hypothetical protein